MDVFYRNTETAEVVQAIDGTELAETLAANGKYEQVSQDTAREVVVPAPPKRSDTKAEWVDYAVNEGATRADADALTKEQLAEQYGDR